MSIKKARTLRKPHLKPVIANSGIESAYRKEMQRLINDMQRDALKRINAVYSKPLNGDELNAELNRIIDNMSEQWDRRFDRESRKIAAQFLKRIDNYTASVLLQQFKTINEDYRARRVLEVDQAMQAAIEINVSLIKSIPEQFHKRIRAIATTTLSHNRDLHFMQKLIRHTSGVTKRRAVLIAKDQANKVTNELAIHRSLSVGITRGIWQHVPGKYSSRRSHVKMDGEEFDLAQGLYDADEGRYVKPGELIACNCRYRPIIPGIR